MSIENLGMSLYDTFKHYMPEDPPEKGTPWLWRGPEVGGYGRLMADNKLWRAHVASYTLFVGPVPPTMFVLHELDVSLDVNPHNLRIGTHADNMRDMVTRGRSSRGERHHMTYLKELEVIEMRKMADAGVSLKELAELFQCSEGVAYKIITNKTWKYVPPTVQSYEKNTARGVNQGLAVLNERIVRQARQMYDDGNTVAQISRDLGIKRSTLNSVLSGTTWTHVPLGKRVLVGKTGGASGETHVRAVLTEDSARLIKQRTREGVSIRTIADELGVSYRTVWGVVKGTTWKDVE